MQVSVENTGPLERKVRVEVPEDKIASEVQNRLQSLSRKTKIQGFRPGKAPLKVVEKHYGSRIRKEVVGEVLQSSFYEALAKEKLRPASQPEIDPMEDEGSGLTYTATFEVYPEIDLAPIDELEIEKPTCQVSDKDLDNMIENIRKQQRTFKKVDRKAADGDVLVIDFEGKVGGEVFEGGSATDYRLELGTGRFIAGFEKGLLGAGEKDVVELDLEFPSDYYNTELAGKPVQFTVTVKEVNEAILPELNEDLFKKMGVEEGGLERFRSEVRRNMEREVEQSLLDRAKNNVLDALYAANTIDLPPSLIRNEAENLRKQFMANLQRQGIPADQIPESQEHTEVITKQAERKVALQLLIADLVRKEEMQVEASQVREMVEKIAESYEDPNEVINWYYSDRQRLAEIEALALEDKVIEWILGRARVSEVEIPFDDLMNSRQTG